MDFAALNKQRTFILITAIAGIISVFLPWLRVSSQVLSISENGFRGFGLYVFLCFVGSIIIALLGDKQLILDKTKWFLVLVLGALALLFTIIFMNDASGAMGMGVGYGIGIWLSLLSAAGVMAAAWLLKNPTHNLHDGFDGVKSKVMTAANGNTKATQFTGTDKVSELERLIKLKEEGKISEDDFQQMKSKLF